MTANCYRYPPAKHGNERNTALGRIEMEELRNRFFIDCEFDGHGAPLLSFGIVTEEGFGGHFRTTETATDPWVIANVMPLMDSHDADIFGEMATSKIGGALRYFMGSCERPVIIADSPVDIGRFCAAISTGDDGGWQSTDFEQMTFEVHNVDCYPTELPGAIQHNALWDARALRKVIQRREALTEMVRLDEEMGLM